MLKKNRWSLLFVLILFSTTCTLEGNIGGDTSYSINFDKNGGNGDSPRSQIVKSSSSIRLPSGDSISKNGFTFGGWNTEPSGEGRDYSVGSFYTPTGNITLYAKWIPITATTYTVTFNANGASGTPPTNISVKSGSSLTLPNGSGLSKSGYTFNGWNTNASGTGTQYNAGGSYTVTGDITLYANWVSSDVTYTVSYNNNGGNGTVPASQTVQSGSTITLPNGSGLSKSGFTFGGWNTNASGSGVLYGAGSIYTPHSNITLYANWNANVTTTSFTVSFNANGGNGTVPVSQTAQSGSSVTLPNGNSLSKSGHTFSGWNTSNAGTGTNYNAGDSYTVTANITLYAKWSTNVSTTSTVTFNANGGSGTVPIAQKVSTGTSITLPSGSGLSKNYSNFGGWNTNSSGSGSNYMAGDTYTVTGNVTLYAKWDATDFSSISGLAAKLSWLQSNAVSGGDYTLEVNTNENISPQSLSYSGKNNITVRIKGIGSNRTVNLSTNGSMFSVKSGVTLILVDNITLIGRNANIASLVYVDGGNLIINSGITITGNNAGNSNYSGGIYVSSGSVTMNGGTISGNSAISGGAIEIYNGTFTMLGGIVSENTVKAKNNAGGCGGGINVVGGNFIISGGVVCDNIGDAGGGIFVNNSGALTIDGGIIRGNFADRGGGVFINSNGTVTMNGGLINGNKAISQGGGIEDSGNFTMHGGVISGNTASRGGGIVSQSDSNFRKLPSTGKQNCGIIYGSEAVGFDTDGIQLKNTSDIGSAVAVYVSSSYLYRNTTAWETDRIDSTIGRGLSASGNPPYGQ